MSRFISAFSSSRWTELYLHQPHRHYRSLTISRRRQIPVPRKNKKKKMRTVSASTELRISSISSFGTHANAWNTCIQHSARNNHMFLSSVQLIPANYRGILPPIYGVNVIFCCTKLIARYVLAIPQSTCSNGFWNVAV